MMVIDYPNSKNTQNVKFMDFKHFKNEKCIEQKIKISRVLYHIVMGCNVHDI
jgi:hypothetical protein